MKIDRAIELQEQAWSLQAEGKLEAALTASREALEIIEESQGPDSPDAANMLNDLAEIEIERQDFSAALALAERALAIEDGLADRFTGETAARIRARTFGLAGEIRRIRGEYAGAESDLGKCLATVQAEFGEASEEAAEACNNLAVLYKYWGRFDEGLRLYRQALRSTIAAGGEWSLASATVYHNIGGILHAQGDFVSAEEPGRKAWEISRRILGEDDPRTMLDAAAYAGILDGLGRYDESEPIYLRALEIFEKEFGPEHYEVAAVLHNLAAVLDARGLPQEAEQSYRRALAIKETLLGSETPDAALTRNNLGRLLTRVGRPGEAVPLLKSAVSILEKRLTPEHPHSNSARENLRQAVLAVAALNACELSPRD